VVNPERGNWQETAKKWAIRGGIVAGLLWIVAHLAAVV